MSTKTATKTSTKKEAAAQTKKTTKIAVAKVQAASENETKKVVRSRPAKSARPAQARPAVSAEQRQHYIEVAAYFIAERKGFAGDPLQDWIEAEAQIDRLIEEGRLGA